MKKFNNIIFSESSNSNLFNKSNYIINLAIQLSNIYYFPKNIFIQMRCAYKELFAIFQTNNFNKKFFIHLNQFIFIYVLIKFFFTFQLSSILKIHLQLSFL